MKFFYTIVFALFIGAAQAQTWTDTTTIVNYKDYIIKKSDKVTAAVAAPMLEMLKKHIDRFPEYVDAKMIAFFKTVPILLSVDEEGPGTPGTAGPGSFGNGKLRIYPRIVKFEPVRPVLLHEYMHAYHFMKLQDLNPTLEKYLEAARASGIYGSGEYMLKNRAEFFAMTSTTLLTGSIAREPLTLDKMKKAMPEYTAWLAKLFGKELK